MNKYYKMKQYEDALKHLYGYLETYDEQIDKDYEMIEQLIYQYKMRLADAELLNKLRTMTNTMGDLDLTSEIQRLIDFERDTLIKESDKQIFTATMVEQ